MSLQLQLKKKHKLINPTEPFTLPDFTVITGLNGSGKTQLLEVLSHNKNSSINSKSQVLKSRVFIQYNTLRPNNKASGSFSESNISCSTAWRRFDTYRVSWRAQDQNRDINSKQFLDDALQQEFGIVAINTIAGTGKQFSEITFKDFEIYYSARKVQSPGLTDINLGTYFLDYKTRFFNNSFNEYLAEKEETDTHFLSEEKFKEVHGEPPWDKANTILMEIGLPYKFTCELTYDTPKDQDFRLSDTKSGEVIQFSELSTGEQVLMALVLMQFTLSVKHKKPDLLLLDEPDAALHPSLSRKMLLIIEKYIVKDAGIPTIITTHSPLTILSASAESLYELKRGESIPLKIEHQQAIEVLTGEIPFIKIATESRRQVFVESKYDVVNYELLSNILYKKTIPSIDPIFIPAGGKKNSNCDDVIFMTEKLSSSGTDTVYGIVDWDTTRSTSERLLVLGEGDRYAIENYLLDPLIMGIFFIRETHLSPVNLNIPSIDNYSDIGSISENDAQNIVDSVLATLDLNIGDSVPYELENGWTLNTTKEFNLHDGHDLETLYKERFPFLKGYHQEGKLKKEIISKVIAEKTEYTPKILFDVLRSIK